MPPAGDVRIEVRRAAGVTRVVLTPRRHPVLALFLAPWLAGWAAGEVSVVRQLVEADAPLAIAVLAVLNERIPLARP